MNKLFVWDFHGTLEKGNELAALEISNRVLEEMGYEERFTEEHAVELYGKKWFEYFGFLLPDAGHDTHVDLQEQCFKCPDNAAVIARHLRPNDHALDVLEAVREGGHGQILISNTSEEALPVFIELARMGGFFDASNSFAVMAHAREALRSKQHVLAEFLAEAGAFDEVVTVGDSVSDVELVTPEEGRGFLYRHPGRPLDAELASHVTPIDDLRGVLSAV